MKNILLTGSTGTIGSKIKSILEEDKVNNLFLPIRGNILEKSKNITYLSYNTFNENNYILKDIDIFIHAATAWDENSFSFNVLFLEKILNCLNINRIKKILILSTASIIKNNVINDDCIVYGNEYIKSKYLQYKMIQNHNLQSKCCFLFITVVTDHKDRIYCLNFLKKYGKYFPGDLPNHSFHTMHSIDIARVCHQIMKIEKTKKQYVIGLPSTNLIQLMDNFNVNFNGCIPFILIKFFLNFFIDKWTYYNLNYFLNQSYDVVYPETFNLIRKYKY